MASPNPKQLKQSPPHPLRSAAFPPCGLLYLPVESLLEILSYFPVISLPRVNGAYDPSVKSTCYTRTDALCALSQTCRALRRTFLQQRWERLDVYARECRRQHAADEQVSKGLVWYKQVAMDLKAKSRGLARNKQLAAYVRYVRPHTPRVHAPWANTAPPGHAMSSSRAAPPRPRSLPSCAACPC